MVTRNATKLTEMEWDDPNLTAFIKDAKQEAIAIINKERVRHMILAIADDDREKVEVVSLGMNSHQLWNVIRSLARQATELELELEAKMEENGHA